MFDAVIAGGGLSGWSLAAHLAHLGWHDRRILLVDDPDSFPSAAAWAFWSTDPGLLAGAVSHSYDRLRVHAAGVARLLRLHPYRYHVVHRGDLIRVARSLTDRCQGLEVRSGRVQSIRDDDAGAVVTVDGEPVRCRWAFDRVSAAPHDRVDARLAFTGWQVRTDGPAFDPQVPVLFDFRTPQGCASRFVYVLPEARDRALVELTEFVPRGRRPLPERERSAAVTGYLEQIRGLRGYDLRRTESAVVPLRAWPARRRSGRSILAVGASAGLVKASTGYAYQRIQRDSAAIAASLVRHGHPFAGPAAPARYRLLDAVLLDVLAHEPAQLERAFADLFRNTATRRVLSFLDETTSLRDDLRIMMALRPMPYLRAVRRLAMRAGG